MTKCTYTNLDAYGEEETLQVTNSQPQKTKEPTANLKINESTGRMNTGVWELFYNSSTAIVCKDKINNLEKKSTLIE